MFRLLYVRVHPFRVFIYLCYTLLLHSSTNGCGDLSLNKLLLLAGLTGRERSLLTQKKSDVCFNFLVCYNSSALKVILLTRLSSSHGKNVLLQCSLSPSLSEKTQGKFCSFCCTYETINGSSNLVHRLFH